VSRAQKYHPRPRALYALVFSQESAVYVGQSVDAHRRRQQHALPSGGWQRPFDFVVLGHCVGTQADAETHEYAWRLVAASRGWRVYGRPPNIVVNPRRRRTWDRWRLSWRLQWSWPLGWPWVYRWRRRAAVAT
jgi:hypothetical protein